MLDKRLIITLFLFIIAIGTLSSVCAADSAGDAGANVTSDELGVENTIDLESNVDVDIESGDDEILGSDSEEVLEADAGTFTALQSKINSASAGSTITLYNDYTYNDDFKSGYTFLGKSVPGINIRKSITINGNGHVIDGASKSVLFYIEADNVKLNNLVFKNAYLGDSIANNIYWAISSAIEVTGDNAVIDNCNYIGISTGSNVGAIYIKGDKSTIKNSKFNTYAGVSLRGDKSTVNNCNFTDCISDGYCDALSVSGNDNTITKCNFYNCHSKDRGGAIELHNEKNTITYSNFINCYSNNDGDTIYKGNGGAIYFWSDSGVVDHCSFLNTYASNNGGAIFIGEFTSGVTVSSCTFNNTRAKDGGAIYRETIDRTVTPSDTTINNCKFISCNAINGAIYSNSTKNKVSNCNFEDCSANSTAGGINFEILCSDSTIADCEFKNCTSVDFAGAVYCYGDNGVLNKCNFYDCNSEDGGAIYWDGISGTISNSKFVRCTADYAGAIDWDGDKATLSGCNFKDCSVNDNGGALYWETDDGKITGCNFEGGSADYGGAIYIDSVNNCNIKSSTFSGNSANYGGAINAYNTTVLKVDSSTFTDNLGEKSGGAIRVNEGYGSQFDKCSFIHNVVQDQNGVGGAISLNNANITIIDSCNFERNSANNSAGAVYINNLDESIIRYSTFSQNSAKYAGAVGALNTNKPYVISSKFTKNTDTGYGGAVYGIVAADCDFVGNSNPQTCSTTIFPGTKLTLKQSGSYFNDNVVVTITLTGKDGAILSNEDVKVTFNGKTNTYKTNSKGQVSFKVTLAPKTYPVTMSFDAHGKYYGSTAKANVVIKKATPKIIAAKKTFRVKVRIKKYAATLKDNKGKVMKNTVVKLSVNGRTFSAKTNSRGMATFKITNLKKKGSFRATLNYAGNSNFNKVSKKVIITVRK